MKKLSLLLLLSIAGGIQAMDVVNKKDHYGNTPLHFACQYSPAVIKSLIEVGADPTIPNHCDKTPLHLACQYSPNKVSLLLAVLNKRQNQKSLNSQECPLNNCAACNKNIPND